MTRHHGSSSEAWQCRNCGAAVSSDATACGYCRSPVGTRRCPQCLQAGRLDSEFCTRCGCRLPAPSVAETVAKTCPGCRRPMIRGTAGELPITSCTSCGGVWLGRDDFMRLCREREAQAALLTGPWAVSSERPAGGRPSRPGYRPCPLCGKLMNRSNFAKYSGLILDSCRDHGTFFDADELPALVQFMRDGGMDRVREREREALKEEERRLSALRRVSPTSASNGLHDIGFRESTLDALLRELFPR